MTNGCIIPQSVLIIPALLSFRITIEVVLVTRCNSSHQEEWQHLIVTQMVNDNSVTKYFNSTKLCYILTDEPFLLRQLSTGKKLSPLLLRGENHKTEHSHFGVVFKKIIINLLYYYLSIYFT